MKHRVLQYLFALVLGLVGICLPSQLQAAPTCTAECLPPPPGGGIPPGRIMDILRLAKDFYGVSMGTVNGWYSAGLLTITETGSYTVTSVNEYGTTTTVQTSYHVCCSGGSDLTVVLSEL